MTKCGEKWSAVNTFLMHCKSNTSFGSVKGLLYLCTHNINKTLYFYKIKKTNMLHFLPSLSWTGALKLTETQRILASQTYIYISIQSFELLFESSNRKQTLHYKIRKDAFLSKAAISEEMASRDQLHLCDTVSENSSLLTNTNIPPKNFFTNLHCVFSGYQINMQNMRIRIWILFLQFNIHRH